MKNLTKSSQQRRLPQSGDALEQDVPACHETDEHSVHDVLLPYDDLRDLGSHAIQLSYGLREAVFVLHVSMVTPSRQTRVGGTLGGLTKEARADAFRSSRTRTRLLPGIMS